MFNYEHKNEPLAPKAVFYNRIIYNLVLGSSVILVSLLIGIIGYHCTANLTWLDSLYNASMILTGMGPVTQLTTPGAKWFASLYALFSGVVFITNIGVILAPVIHRFFHRLHVEDDDNKDNS